MTESALLADILLAFGSRPGIRLWRCNTGVARDRSGRIIRFGVPGQADIQGVLAPSGRHISVEVKSPTGRQSKEQAAWERMVTSLGGLYVLARTVEDVERALGPLPTPSLSPSSAAGEAH